MIQRCTNPNAANYYKYGERGITVCEEWLKDFRNFLKDMGVRPEGTSLDRINSKENYEPHNCKWSTPSEQNALRNFTLRTHCKKGHELTADNSFISTGGSGRSYIGCRTCRTAYIKEYNKR